MNKKNFFDRHWIIFNPLTILIYAHIALYIIFSLLGWEE